MLKMTFLSSAWKCRYLFILKPIRDNGWPGMIIRSSLSAQLDETGLFFYALQSGRRSIFSNVIP